MELINASLLFCEYVENEENNFSVHKIFNEIKSNKDNEEGFCIVMFGNTIEEVNCDLHIFLENHTGDEPKFKKLETISINNEEKIINNIVQICRFRTKKMISVPGRYLASVYKTEQLSGGEVLENQDIVKRENLIAITSLQVK